MRYTVKLNWCLPDFIHQQLWQNPDDPSYSNQDNFSLLLIFPLPNKNHHDTSTNILLVLCWDIPWTNGYVLACGPFGSKLSRFTPTFFSTKHEHKKPWDPAKWCLLTVCLFFVSDPFWRGPPSPTKHQPSSDRSGDPSFALTVSCCETTFVVTSCIRTCGKSFPTHPGGSGSGDPRKEKPRWSKNASDCLNSSWWIFVS